VLARWQHTNKRMQIHAPQSSAEQTANLDAQFVNTRFACLQLKLDLHQRVGGDLQPPLQEVRGRSCALSKRCQLHTVSSTDSETRNRRRGASLVADWSFQNKTRLGYVRIKVLGGKRQPYSYGRGP
jgi:hypothetical protein